MAGQPGALEWISRLSLTQTLRTFEQGLLSLGLLLGIVAAIGGFAALSAVWLHPGVPPRTKLVRSLACVAAVAAVFVLATRVTASVDLTEDRRNSFPAADQRALAELREPLVITVHLAPEDPRYVDLRRNVLAKLERALPGVTIRLATTGQSVVGSSERGGLRRGRVLLRRAAPTEPLDQPPRDPAAALCAGGKAGSAAGRAARTIRATRWSPTRDAGAAVVLRRPSVADRPRLVVEPPPAASPAQLVKDGGQP